MQSEIQEKDRSKTTQRNTLHMIEIDEFLDNIQRGAKKARWVVLFGSVYIIAAVAFILVS